MHLEDKKKSRLLFWTVFIMYVLVYMTKSCFSAAMAAIVNEGALTKSQTGLISAVFYIVYAPLQIVGGIVADRCNPERLVKIGLVGAAIANAIIFFNQHYIVMLVIWTLNAIVQFAVWPSVFKILSSQLAPEHRERAVFFISFSSTLGILIAYLVAAFVRRWQDNFAISSIVLIVSMAALHIVTRRVEPYMVPDTVPRGFHGKRSLDLVQHNMSNAKIFWMGCLYFMTIQLILRCAVENGVKTLSATMLMESYANISPSIGNLLNTLIILSGVVGLLFTRFVLFPRIFKNEMTCTFVLMAVCIPLLIVLRFVGTLNVWVILLCLCIVTALLNGTQYISMSYNMQFAKYGLNGSVAGITNAGGSLGLVLQCYIFPLVAENFGWPAIMDMGVFFVGVSALLMLVAIPIWKKFTSLKHT